MDLHNRVAIVTGASRGIGAAIAEALAAAGCHVVLAARSEARITVLAEQLHADYGVRTLAVKTDLSVEAEVRRLVAQAESAFGAVDILINNAGMGIYGAMDEVKMADLRHIFEVNFFGAVAAMQAVVPGMRRQGGGIIVNISSVVGKFPSPLGGGYTATKYALEGASAAARAELARDNIKVVVVRPGLTETEFSQHSRVSVPGAEDQEGERHAPWRGMPPAWVAKRTLQAIRKEEREVYVTFFDRLLVFVAAMLPGLFARGLVRAAALRRRRFARHHSQVARSPQLAASPLLLLGALAAVTTLFWWRRRS
jgi:short-subunit dehydrogenase